MEYFNPDPKPEKPILLTGKAKAIFRKQICDRAGSQCETCGKDAPLRDGDGDMNVFSCGHVSHNGPRNKVGDRPEVVKWECYECHIGWKHGPRWSYKKNLRHGN